MEPDQIPRADLLDILFEGRNKSYGAYDLRKSYNRRLGKAISITLSLCLLLIFGYVLAGKLHKERPVAAFPPDIFTPIEIPKDKAVVIPPPAARRPPPRQQVATINDARTRIVPNDQVRPEDRPHTVDEMDEAKLGTVNRTGVPDDSMGPVAPAGTAGTGLLDAPKQKEEIDDRIVPVEIESYYIGGKAAWTRFLTRMIRYPEAAVDKNIEGTVIVQFVVDKEGKITDVQAISGPEELRGEAVRAIRTTQGKWFPGIQNGRKVKSYKQQPITFLLGKNG